MLAIASAIASNRRQEAHSSPVVLDCASTASLSVTAAIRRECIAAARSGCTAAARRGLCSAALRGLLIVA